MARGSYACDARRQARRHHRVQGVVDQASRPMRRQLQVQPTSHPPRYEEDTRVVACSKAGLWMLTRVLAQELSPYNISVNELIPGPVVTSMAGVQTAQRQGVSAIEGEWIKTPEEVVPLALFLATQPPIGPTAQSFSLMRRDN